MVVTHTEQISIDDAVGSVVQLTPGLDILVAETRCSCGSRGKYRVKILTRFLRPMPVVSVAAVGPYETTTAEAWIYLRALLTKHGLRETCKPVFALLRDLPQQVRPTDRRLELCAAVDNDARTVLKSEATLQTFNGGDYLIHTHRGPYDALPDVFSRMSAACSLDMNVSVDIKRPRVVFFKGDPDLDAPDDLVAELCVPIGRTSA